MARFEEAGVARERLGHVRRMRLQELLQKEGLLRGGERFSGLQRGNQVGVEGFAAGVLIHLRHHGGHQVEGLAHVGEFAQDLDHAVVILEGVQTSPWQLVLAGGKILIERLVHVPEEAEIDAGHGLLVGQDSSPAAGVHAGLWTARGGGLRGRRRLGACPTLHFSVDDGRH